jgi:hypothetical protein
MLIGTKWNHISLQDNNFDVHAIQRFIKAKKRKKVKDVLKNNGKKTKGNGWYQDKKELTDTLPSKGI